jgi:hypothetical protein
VLTAAAVLLAWPQGSTLVPRDGGRPVGDSVWAWCFLGLLIAAFAVYAVALLLIRATPPQLAAATAVACAIQLVPLAVPLLLSTDAWAYWSYGRLASVHDANPYLRAPSAYPDDPSYGWVGTHWRDSTTVYGPAFTLASEPLARAAGSAGDAAAWIFKSLAAACVLATAVLASRLSVRPVLALALVGWNPLLAVHFGGGGHNDAWLALLVVAALAAGAAGRRHAAGAFWSLGLFVKWVPLVFLPLRAVQARATGRRVGHLAFAVAVAALAAAAVVAYGTDWLHAFGPLARNANQETTWALPHRLEQLGVPRAAAIAVFAAAFAAAYLWLLREAARGRSRLGLAACALLLASPYLVVWYVVWALALAAAEDDEPAVLVALALCAYLIRQTVPV